MPKVSVIIPVYNVETYVALSVESALDQTLADIEVICVDDGSLDASGDLIDALSSLDGRIRVIRKKNGGLSSARNAGLAAATGDIVCFLDSDDLLVDSACETLLKTFSMTGADVVTYGAFPYPEENGYPWLNEVLSPQRIDYNGFDDDILFKEKSSPFAWRTACRRSYLKQIGLLFDETLPYGEDQVFQFQLYPRCNRVSFIPDKLVRYRVSRKGSFMDSRLNDLERMAFDHISIVQRIICDWSQLGFLSGRAHRVLDWISDFSLVRIFSLPESSRLKAINTADKVLLSYFDEEDLKQYVSAGNGGGFIDAMHFDRSLASGKKNKRLLTGYYLRACGKRYVLRLKIDRIKLILPFRKPFSSKKRKEEAEAERKRIAVLRKWEREDLEERKRAYLKAAEAANCCIPEWRDDVVEDIED